MGKIPSALAFTGGLNLDDFFPACEYRTGGALKLHPPSPISQQNKAGDAVGTAEGSANGVFIQNITLPNLLLNWNIIYDNKRQKYADLNVLGLAQYPASGPDGSPIDEGITGANQASWWDVEEYNVVGTEGSDWLNYTHDFGDTTNYNVYLRAACMHSQYVNLYNDATTNRANLMGVFSNYNTLPWNWRYVPLTDTNGTNAVVALGGVKTLRLEIDPDKPNWTEIRRGLTMNYMAFVPVGGPQLVYNITYSTTNRITSVVNNRNGTFTVNVLGTPGAQYYLVTSGNIKTAMGSWTTVAGSTTTASSPNGTWSYTVSAGAPAYYRSVAVNPHP